MGRAGTGGRRHRGHRRSGGPRARRIRSHAGQGHVGRPAAPPTASDGLSDDDDAHTERCRTHGLLYDKRKSNGCRRCIEGRRSANRTDRPGGRLRDNPPKRAFAGLGLALAVGFLPAAYWAKGPGAEPVARLRAEQSDLSQKAGTEEVLTRFDEIDTQVAAAGLRNMRNTLFIWVAGSGLVLVAFYRFI